MQEFPGYTTYKRLESEENIFVYEGVHNEENFPVQIKLVPNLNLTTEQNSFVQQRLAALKKIHPELIFPEEIERHPNGTVFTFREYSAMSLHESLLSKPIDILGFLDHAIAIVNLIGALHDNNIIHGDINPSNILFNPRNRKISLFCCGALGEIFRRQPEVFQTNSIDGYIEYMSPEQTGRMNRAVDHRTDFYSLGILFYEMLTGEAPFKEKDVLEQIHAHIVKIPTPASVLKKEVPELLSKIIQKLLSKSPKGRYQTWQGLLFDLEACRKQYSLTEDIPDFQLGKKDFFKNLIFSDKLYNHQNTLETISGLISNLKYGSKRVVVLTGESGVGKTFLIKKVLEGIPSSAQFFISGKFESLIDEAPYKSLLAPFRKLCLKLLTGTEESLKDWKNKITGTLGINGQIIIDQIPELELIIVNQPVLQTVPANEAINRFNEVLINFISLFGSAEAPLILFFDDLHWADKASLSFMDMLIDRGLDSIFILISYSLNSNTLLKDHEIIRNNKKVHSILLGPLTLENICSLLQDTFGSQEEETKKLATVVFSKTTGNVLFIKEFLNFLYHQEFLVFDSGNGMWCWDVAKISEISISNNVVDLIISRIDKIGPSTKDILEYAACLDGSFLLSTLSYILQKSDIEIVSVLQEAVDDNLFRFHSEFSNEVGAFQHERIRQAVYNSIPEKRKKEIHLAIGNALYKKTDSEVNELVFLVTNQLNLGSDLISDVLLRENLARLNYQAGLKAKNNVAYSIALAYLEKGIRMLKENCWQVQADLAFDLHVCMAECQYALGEFEATKNSLKITLEQSLSNFAKAKVHNLQTILYHNLGQFKKAIFCGVQGLNLLGVKIPLNPGKSHVLKGLLESKLLLSKKDISDLIYLPVIQDPEKELAMNLLVNIFSPAYFVNQDMMGLAVFKILNLSLKFGNSAISSLAFVFYGLLSSSKFGNYDKGYAFGEIAAAINYKFADDTYRCKTNLIIGSSLIPWKKHIRYSMDVLLDAKISGEKTGDYMYAGYATSILTEYSFIQGEPLDVFFEKNQNHFKFLKKVKYEDNLHFYLVIMRMASIMQSKEVDPEMFEGFIKEEDHLKYLQQLENKGQHVPITAYYIFKEQEFYFKEEYQKALEMALLAEKKISLSNNLLHAAEHCFYFSLSILAMYPAFSTFKKAKYGILLRLNLSKMKKWARICPENFQHKYLLVLAEWARVQGKNVLALQLYEKAVQKASTNGFLQNEAMAAELTGKFYIAMDLGSGAHPHLIRAQKSYTLRGCKLKLKQLSQKYPHVLPPYYENQVFENAVEEVTDEIQFSKLDLISINKASQAISKEISRDELIQKLLKITIENTCAGRGILFLNNAENILKVEAVGEFYTENIIQLRPKETFFSTAVVNLVTRSKNLLVLNDISEESDYANDKYILENNIKSLLCIPILAQSELLGLFYLENNYTTNAFTVKNMEVLNILVSQAAISLKNAELFNEKVTLTVQLAEKNNGLLAEIEGRQVIEKKLNQKNEELNTFLYRSSHDLRGPLASIMGLSTIAKNEITDKSATIYFDMIHQSTSKLDHILLDLVQVAQAKQTALLKQEIYLDILLHEVIDSLKFSKDFNKLRIDIKGKGGVVFWSDKSALITIVQNILENAFRYRKKKNDDSFLEIDIDSNEKEIHLNFRDNGIGIPKEMIDKIFEMFFKSNEDANSSGLGLYIVKCAIEKLKGSISVYSDGFSGTEFKVVLPVYS